MAARYQIWAAFLLFTDQTGVALNFPSSLSRRSCFRLGSVSAVGSSPFDSIARYIVEKDYINQSDLTGQYCLTGTHGGKNGGCRGGHVAKIVRNVANIVPSGAGWAWAEANGAECGWNKKNQILICKGVDNAFADGPKGGITIGSVFLTQSPDVSSCVSRHEGKHANQWSVYGAGFTGVYLTAEAFAAFDSWSMSEKRFNDLEVQAGLADGGYTEGAC